MIVNYVIVTEHARKCHVSLACKSLRIANMDKLEIKHIDKVNKPPCDICITSDTIVVSSSCECGRASSYEECEFCKTFDEVMNKEM